MEVIRIQEEKLALEEQERLDHIAAMERKAQIISRKKARIATLKK